MAASTSTDGKQPEKKTNLGLNLHWPELGGAAGGAASGDAGKQANGAKERKGLALSWPELGGTLEEDKDEEEGAGAAAQEQEAASASTSTDIVPAPSFALAACLPKSAVLAPPTTLALAVPQGQDWASAVDGLIDDAARKYLEDAAARDYGRPQDHYGSGFSDMEALAVSASSGSQDVAEVAALVSSGAIGPPPKSSGEPKGTLNHLCQKLCRRPITKQDVVYTVYSVGRGRWKATVKLNCVKGLEFGSSQQPCADRKAAEKAAAAEALLALTGEAPAPAPAPQAAPLPIASFPPAPPQQQQQQQQQPPQQSTALVLAPPLGMPAFSQAPHHPMPVGRVSRGNPALEPSPGAVQDAPPGSNPKTALNEALGRICRGPLVKDSTCYVMNTVPGGYQAQLTLPCLPGVWSTQVWVSRICQKKKDAETNAAQAALAAIMADSQMMSIVTAPKPVTPSYYKGGGKGGIRAQQAKLTSAAPKTKLSIALEGEGGNPGSTIWSVDIGPATTLLSVRAILNESRISGAPSSYLFASCGIPVPRDQEGMLPARDFLPVATLISEDFRGLARKRRARSASVSDCSPAPTRSKGHEKKRTRGRSRSRDSAMPRGRR